MFDWHPAAAKGVEVEAELERRGRDSSGVFLLLRSVGLEISPPQYMDKPPVL